MREEEHDEESAQRDGESRESEHTKSNNHRRFPFSLQSRRPDAADEGHVFDSRAHRYCCNAKVHAKIGAFVLTSLLIHEIALGLLYVTNRPEWTSTPSLISIVACRLCQLISALFTYAALWKRNPYLLIPFVVTQLTIGAYADLSTWMLVVREAEGSRVPSFLFSTPLLYVVVPLLLYAAFCVFFTYAMYKCYAYCKARSMDAIQREEFTQMETLVG